MRRPTWVHLTILWLAGCGAASQAPGSAAPAGRAKSAERPAPQASSPKTSVDSSAPVEADEQERTSEMELEAEEEEPPVGMKRRGAVELGAINVAAPAIEPAAIAEVVARQRSSIESCYLNALANDPELKGALKITFSIGGDGRVVEARGSGEGPLEAAGVEACVEGVFRGMEFPASNRPETTSATFPLVFVPR